MLRGLMAGRGQQDLSNGIQIEMPLMRIILSSYGLHLQLNRTEGPGKDTFSRALTCMCNLAARKT